MLLPRASHFLALVCIYWLFGLAAPAVADECSPLLQQGIFDKVDQTTSYNSARARFSQYCSQYISDRASGHNADANLFTEAFAFGGSYSDSQRDQISEAFCGLSNDSSQEQNANSLASTNVDPTLAQEFVKCEQLAADAQGLHFSSTFLNDIEGVTLDAYYSGLAPVSKSVLVIYAGSAYHTRSLPPDVKCIGDLDDATKLGTGHQSITCTRKIFTSNFPIDPLSGLSELARPLSLQLATNADTATVDLTAVPVVAAMALPRATGQHMQSFSTSFRIAVGAVTKPGDIVPSVQPGGAGPDPAAMVLPFSVPGIVDDVSYQIITNPQLISHFHKLDCVSIGTSGALGIITSVYDSSDMQVDAKIIVHYYVP